MTNISSYSEWGKYRRELLKGFRKSIKEHRKIKEVKVVMYKIDWRLARIANEEVNMRQDHKKELHQENIDRYYREANELIEILNENFVMEILLGD